MALLLPGYTLPTAGCDPRHIGQPLRSYGLTQSWCSLVPLLLSLQVAADLVQEICEQMAVSETQEIKEFALFATKDNGKQRALVGWRTLYLLR